MLQGHTQAMLAGRGIAGVVVGDETAPWALVGHVDLDIKLAFLLANRQHHIGLLGRVFVGELYRFGHRTGVRHFAGDQARQSRKDVLRGKVRVALDNDPCDARFNHPKPHLPARDFLLRELH